MGEAIQNRQHTLVQGKLKSANHSIQTRYLHLKQLQSRRVLQHESDRKLVGTRALGFWGASSHPAQHLVGKALPGSMTSGQECDTIDTTHLEQRGPNGSFKSPHVVQGEELQDCVAFNVHNARVAAGAAAPPI